MALTRVKNNQLTGSIATSKLASGSSFLTSLPSGSVLQVVGGINHTDLAQSGDTTNMEAAISQAITPSATSSKILIIGAIEIHLYASVRVDATVNFWRTVGGANTTLDYTTLYNLHGSGTLYPYEADKIPFMHLDSPNTTSEVTYSLRFRQGSSSGTVYTCTANGLGASNLICQEIKG